jgi:MoaD family protein
MAIEVRIPTILRSYTGGAKAVEGSGDTLADLLTDLDARHPGLRDRLIKDGALHRFVNIYINDEDVRFLGSLDAKLADGDNVTILPAVAGGALPALGEPAGSCASRLRYASALTCASRLRYASALTCASRLHYASAAARS